MFISALKSTRFAYNFFIFVNILFVKSAEVWIRQIFWRQNFLAYGIRCQICIIIIKIILWGAYIIPIYLFIYMFFNTQKLQQYVTCTWLLYGLYYLQCVEGLPVSCTGGQVILRANFSRLSNVT